MSEIFDTENPLSDFASTLLGSFLPTPGKTCAHESEATSNIYPAFLAAQCEIEAVKKNAINEHIGKSYADLTAVIEALKPVLPKHGLGYIQKPQPSVDSEARLTTRVIHTSGEWFECTITVPAVVLNKSGMEIFNAQSYGAAMTYARRYSLSAIFNLAQEDNDGEMGQHDLDSDDLDADMDGESIQQRLENAKSMQELLKVMNELTTKQQIPYREFFKQRIASFKKSPAKTARKRTAK